MLKVCLIVDSTNKRASSALFCYAVFPELEVIQFFCLVFSFFFFFFFFFWGGGGGEGTKGSKMLK